MYCAMLLAILNVMFKKYLQDMQNVNDLKKEGLFKSILFLFSRAATAVFT